MRLNRLLRTFRDAQGGFTLVEVVIAIMLLAVVATSVTVVAAGSKRVQQTTAAHDKVSGVAEAVYEQIRADKSWTQLPGVKATLVESTNTGAKPSFSLQPGVAGRTTGSLTGELAAGAPVFQDHDLGVTFKLQALQVKAVHETADLTNHVSYYLVRVSVAAPDAATAKRIGMKTNPITVTSTIDPTGTARTGGQLNVQFCRVFNQADGRMSISSCDDKAGAAHGTFFQMAGCAGGVSGLSCNAWNAAHPLGTNFQPPSDYVAVEPVTASFTLTGPVTRSCDTTIAGGCTSAHLVDGAFRFDDLPPGNYTIRLLHPVDPAHPSWWVPWATRSLPGPDPANPAAVRVSVQSDIASNAMVLLRPEHTGAVHVKLQREVGYDHFYETEVRESMGAWHNGTCGTIGLNPDYFVESCSGNHYKRLYKDYFTHAIVATYNSYSHERVEVRSKRVYFGGRTWGDIFQGPPAAAGWTTQPAPEGRYLVNTGTWHPPTFSSGVASGVGDLRDVPTTVNITGIVPGLNAPLLNIGSSQSNHWHTGAVGESTRISSNVNGACPFIWVYQLSGASGCGTGPALTDPVTVTGTGECASYLDGSLYGYALPPHNGSSLPGQVSPSCEHQFLWNGQLHSGWGHAIYERYLVHHIRISTSCSGGISCPGTVDLTVTDAPMASPTPSSMICVGISGPSCSGGGGGGGQSYGGIPPQHSAPSGGGGGGGGGGGAVDGGGSPGTAITNNS